MNFSRYGGNVHRTISQEELLEQLSAEAGSIGRAEREKLVKEKKTAWAQELESL